MYFRELIGQFSGTIPLKVLSDALSLEVHDIEFLDGRQTLYIDTTLYFGLREQIKDGQYPPQCILLGSDASGIVPAQESNLALTDQTGLFILANEAQRSISISRGQDLYHELLDVASRGYDTMEHGANTAASRVGNPLVLLGTDMNVIVCSTVYPFRDKFWAESIRRGHFSYAFRNAILGPDVLPGSATSEPFIVTSADSPLRILVSRIYIGGNYAGVTLMLEQDTPISSLHIELLPIISAATGEILRRYAPYLISAGSVYQKVLYDMLIGVSLKEITPRIAGLQFPLRMCALCVRQERSMSRKRLRNEIAVKLAALFPEIRMTFYDEGIAAILPLDEQIELSAEKCGALESFGQENDLRIGVSVAFFVPEEFPLHYAQAYRAIALASVSRENTALCLYSGYIFQDLLDTAGKSASLDSLCHPALTILKQYDHENSTELYNTLQAFLLHNYSNKDAAQALFIHRNTMNYRMDCIKRLTGLGLGSSEVRFQLEMSYRINDYLNLSAFRE